MKNIREFQCDNFKCPYQDLSTCFLPDFQRCASYKKPSEEDAEELFRVDMSLWSKSARNYVAGRYRR